ncbi:NAD(P)-dependent alcohol dehydrogenase [Arthrobacter sp. JZ12]|uniref:NAD(P)-dependent alcohol dehydrogenase n=1 Tax=Arthrobacter sp. JZ12 TaxID=2654190 RepID=UPI003A5CC8D6
MDLAGTVVAAGSEVTRLKPGDEVFGSGRGTYAEYAAASSDMVSLKPAALSFAQAAAIPVSAVTALQGLRKAGRIEPGQQVLITGASGGVGSYAIQMAKALGAEVTGLSSAGKFDFVRSLGADHLIDYRKTGFPRASRGYDVILDIAGNPSLRSLRSALTQNGTAVIGGGEEGGTLTGGIGRQLGAVMLSPFIRQRLAMFLGLVRAADLEELARMIDDGQLVPALDRTFPLDQAQLALRSLEAGEVRGKVAITL